MRFFRKGTRYKLDKPQIGLSAYPAPSRRLADAFLSSPRSKKVLALLLILLLCLAAGFGGGWLGARVYNESNQPVSTKAQQKYVSSESELIAEIAKNVGAGVVSINVESQVSTSDFFGRPRSSTQESAGTGFIVDAAGIILTNRHVVPPEAKQVSVTLSDGTNYENVEVIGRTSEGSSLDVAFLKIKDLQGKKLTSVTLGDSSKVKVGDHVVAIGNALGEFQNTVTSGIISGFGRDVTAGDASGQTTEELVNLFQTDAAINAGNSGGPLVNINGEVIGVNTAVAGGAQNIGFAIPINDTKSLISSVLQTGKLQLPYLGVRYVSLNDKLATELEIDVKRGAYIVPATAAEPSVLPGSPAEKAGLKEKDIITKVDSTAIDDKTSLSSALNKHKVGDKVTLTIVRGGQTITAEATLAEAPSS